MLLVLKHAQQKRIENLGSSETSMLSQQELIDDDSVIHGIQMSAIVDEVASLCQKSNRLLAGWVTEFMQNRCLVKPRVSRKKNLPVVTSTSNVSKIYILEGIALMKERHSSGNFTNYPVLMDHFKSEKQTSS